MKPIDVIKQAEGTVFHDQDGNIDKMTLWPPLTARELKGLQALIACPLPDEARELLLYCRGFDGVLESLDFSGLLGGAFGMEDIFPHAIPIAHDGFGNYWLIDLTKESTCWGPIFYACHDPAVIVFQTDSLAHFISEVIRFGNPPWKSEIDDVHEIHAKQIWTQNPGAMTYEQCQVSNDPALKTFSNECGEKFLYFDLRNAQTGDGFSWGRYGAKTLCKRHGDQRIFAYEIRPTFWQRIFGKK